MNLHFAFLLRCAIYRCMLFKCILFINFFYYLAKLYIFYNSIILISGITINSYLLYLIVSWSYLSCWMLWTSAININNYLLYFTKSNTNLLSKLSKHKKWIERPCKITVDWFTAFVSRICFILSTSKQVYWYICLRCSSLFQLNKTIKLFRSYNNFRYSFSLI